MQKRTMVIKKRAYSSYIKCRIIKQINLQYEIQNNRNNIRLCCTPDTFPFFSNGILR